MAPFSLFVFYSPLHGDKNRKKKHNKKRPSRINKITLANSNMNLWKPKNLSLKNKMNKISLIWYIDIKSYLTQNYVSLLGFLCEKCWFLYLKLPLFLFFILIFILIFLCLCFRSLKFTKIFLYFFSKSPYFEKLPYVD